VPTANMTLSPTNSYVQLNPAASVTLNTTTAISSGTTAGNVLVLENISTSFTVTINNGANTKLGASPRSLGPAGTLTLIWDGTAWNELSFK